MKYITHHRFNELAYCGRALYIQKQEEVEEIDGFLYLIDPGTGAPQAICHKNSENAKRHFARNDDGKGWERGRLSFKIAFGHRDAGDGFRFSDDEIEMLERDYKHWLRQDVDTILFNDDFFDADPVELEKLANILSKKEES